jgi:hypothetical protein
MSPAGLIRALGTPERNDMRQGIENNAELHAVAKRRSNYSFNPTGLSIAFIVDLAVSALLPGGLIRALDTLLETRELRLEQGNGKDRCAS